MSATVSQLPGRLDLTLVRGATFRYRVTYQDGDPLAPVDLTGYAARMAVGGWGGALTVLTTGAGLTLGGAAGTVDFLISATDTAECAPDVYWYDLFLTDGDGDKIPLVGGNLTVTDSPSGEP